MPRAEREQRMLDAAGRAFARDGYHDSSMDEIARVAGISKPMLYNYFGSKEGLYVAYVRRSGRTLLQQMRAYALVNVSCAQHHNTCNTHAAVFRSSADKPN